MSRERAEMLEQQRIEATKAGKISFMPTIGLEEIKKITRGEFINEKTVKDL